MSQEKANGKESSIGRNNVNTMRKDIALSLYGEDKLQQKGNAKESVPILFTKKRTHKRHGKEAWNKILYKKSDCRYYGEVPWQLGGGSMIKFHICKLKAKRRKKNDRGSLYLDAFCEGVCDKFILAGQDKKGK